MAEFPALSHLAGPSRRRVARGPRLAFLGFASALLWAASSVAVQTPESRVQATAADPARVAQLTAQLRCVVCQNQSIAESQAPLAVELRQQVGEQLAGGATDAQVLDFMVQRYGDFVLYKPPLKPLTLLLWLGPALMLALGLLTLWRRVRQQAVGLPMGNEEGHADLAAAQPGATP